MHTCKGFPDGAGDKESPAKAGDIRDTGLIPGLGRSPAVVWWATVDGTAESWTRLDN